MNFLPFEGSFAVGASQAQLGEQMQAVPQLREEVSSRQLLLGVRPEHVRLSDSAPLRAQVLGTEYLGHNQIVIVETASGTRLRAKVPVQQRAVRGDAVGLEFDTAEISLFDKASGRALQTSRYDTPLAGAARHG